MANGSLLTRDSVHNNVLIVLDEVERRVRVLEEGMGGSTTAVETPVIGGTGVVSATENDALAGYLSDKLVVTAPLAAAIQDAGGDESLRLDMAAHLTPDAHHAPVTAGAGVAVAGQEVALQTPGTLSASTANNAAGNHTHAVDSSIARSVVQIIAGNGLTGSGDLTVDRTVNVVARNGLTVAADSIALTTPGTLSVDSTIDVTSV